MGRMIVMLTAILLLGSASVAAAECAWVAWMRAELASPAKPLVETEEPSGRPPQIVEVEWVKVGVRQAPRSHVSSGIANAKVIPRVHRSYIFDSMIFGKTLVCLPDTIDPHERKE